MSIFKKGEERKRGVIVNYHASPKAMTRTGISLFWILKLQIQSWLSRSFDLLATSRVC